MVNHDEYQYLHNLETVMNEGRDYESRNGVVKSMFGTKMILIYKPITVNNEKNGIQNYFTRITMVY